MFIFITIFILDSRLSHGLGKSVGVRNLDSKTGQKYVPYRADSPSAFVLKRHAKKYNHLKLIARLTGINPVADKTIGIGTRTRSRYFRRFSVSAVARSSSLSLFIIYLLYYLLLTDDNNTILNKM